MVEAVEFPHATLGQELLGYIVAIEEMSEPGEVLDALHRIAKWHCDLGVMAAVRLPYKAGTIDELAKGKTVFIHPSVPAGWWRDYVEFSRKQPGLGFMLAQMSLAPFTASEMLRMVQPLGIDHWSTDLARKYGMRDGLTCPVGGRWIVAYWSSKVLTEDLSEEVRAMLFMGATFAAIRLQKIVSDSEVRPGEAASLTNRELAVLRLMSFGHQTAEVADLLSIGGETVRSHLKKAQTKLGVRNRTHAVAQAIRRHLIP